MKLASEEMLLKVGEIHVDLSIRYQDTMVRITILLKKKCFVEVDYKACLRENDMIHVYLALKS